MTKLLLPLLLMILALSCPLTSADEYPVYNPLPLIQGKAPDDARLHYDVQYYRIDLRIDTDKKRVAGTVLIRARALVDGLRIFSADLRNRKNTVERVAWVSEFKRDDDRLPLGQALKFEHGKERIEAPLPRALKAGETFMVAITYHGSSSAVIFRKTPKDRKPWVGTSCQGPGAHSWWPCKSSWKHPEDKPDAVDMNLTVDSGLVAAGPGRLWKTVTDKQTGRKTYRWRMDYPILTYSVSMAVSNYSVLTSEVKIDGLAKPVPVVYYVLPRDVENAKKEFAIVPEMLRYFSKVFGPWPFPKAKFALVQTSYWGMEHSTLVAYGNGFPAATGRRARGGKRYPGKFYYDYILIHEVAHEWWGNSVSAGGWGHFWIHEGFGTYAEPLWLEHKYGKQAYQAKMRQLAQGSSRGSVFRKRHANSSVAYSGVIYNNGACVLHMLRGVMRDKAFFSAIKSFHQDARFLYKNATTEDFRATCEKEYGKPLKWFFDQWVYGADMPRVSATETHDGNKGLLTVTVEGGPASFKMPYDISLTSASGARVRRRFWIKRGVNTFPFEAAAKITDVKLLGKDWILDIGRSRRARPRGIRLGITLGTGAGEGVLVASVSAGSNAARAGLKVGDRILLAGGRKIAGQTELRAWLRSAKRGKRVKLVVLRQQQRVPLAVTLR